MTRSTYLLGCLLGLLGLLLAWKQGPTDSALLYTEGLVLSWPILGFLVLRHTAGLAWTQSSAGCGFTPCPKCPAVVEVHAGRIHWHERAKAGHPEQTERCPASWAEAP